MHGLGAKISRICGFLRNKEHNFAINLIAVVAHNWPDWPYCYLLIFLFGKKSPTGAPVEQYSKKSIKLLPAVHPSGKLRQDSVFALISCIFAL